MTDWNSCSAAEQLMKLCEQQQQEIETQIEQIRQLSADNAKLRSTLQEMQSVLEESQAEILRLREELEKPIVLRSWNAAHPSTSCSAEQKNANGRTWPSNSQNQPGTNAIETNGKGRPHYVTEQENKPKKRGLFGR